MNTARVDARLCKPGLDMTSLTTAGQVVGLAVKTLDTEDGDTVGSLKGWVAGGRRDVLVAGIGGIKVLVKVDFLIIYFMLYFFICQNVFCLKFC